MTKLSIVIPIYHNEKNLPVTYEALKKEVLVNVDDYELILVDDGSKDNSYEVMQKLYLKDNKIKLVKLSRNFGQHQAILAGLMHATGDCMAVISADLQDPPSLLLEMYLKWQEGFKVVLAVRKERKETLSQRFFSGLFYKLMKKYALKDMPEGGFDCFLADKKVIDTLISIDEKNTSLFMQVLWLGFKRAEIYYTREERKLGKSTWSFSKKIKLFLDSFLGFSYLPVRLISGIGLLYCIFSIFFIFYLVFHKLFVSTTVLGWVSVMIFIAFTSGLQMLMLGIIGEYLWRNFDATRKRPTFVIEEIKN